MNRHPRVAVMGKDVSAAGECRVSILMFKAVTVATLAPFVLLRGKTNGDNRLPLSLSFPSRGEGERMAWTQCYRVLRMQVRLKAILRMYLFNECSFALFSPGMKDEVLLFC